VPRVPRPAWCERPFDPEGILSSVAACISGLMGLWFGQVLAAPSASGHRERLAHWLPLSLFGLALGLLLHFVPGGMPLNKNLWSLSYVALMLGVDGLAFAAFYCLVDWHTDKEVALEASSTHHALLASDSATRFANGLPPAATRAAPRTVRSVALLLLHPLLAMGQNALLVFVLAQSSTNVDSMIRWIYWDTSDQNLVDFYIDQVLVKHLGYDAGYFVWALTKVASWLLIAVLLKRHHIFWKL